MATEPDLPASSALARSDAALQCGEVQVAFDVLSAALRGFTGDEDVREVAMTCARMGSLVESFVGNRTAARAWFARAARLLRDEPDCLEQGWVALAGVGCDVDDPAELRARAALALDRARCFGDVNLEAKALADGGLAAVQAGDIVDGMAMLDEAIALWCGPANDQGPAQMGVCSFFTACYYAGAYERVGTWVEDLRRVGLVGHAPGPPVFLHSHCDAVQATALIELGRWSEAEQLLTTSAKEFEARMPMPSWHPAIALADLRIRQGRLAEAEDLLLGKDDHLQALLPMAHLHLARGDLDLARATARRGLRMIGTDRLRAAELLAVVADAELAEGQVDAAQEAGHEMAVRAEGLDVPGLRARVIAVQARVLATGGDLAAAISTMEQAVDALPALGRPVLRAALLADLVRLHEQAGNRAAATVEAARAASAVAGLDITVDPERRALLDRFARGAPQQPAPTAHLSLQGATCVAACAGDRVRLPATKGVRYLAELVGSPGVERHVLDLVDRIEGLAADGPDRHRLGDAGELLDSTARSAYRRRVEELRSEIEDAIEAGAEERAAQLQDECDQLVAQLASAFGLYGRSRTAASAAERARLNVTRCLRTAVARIRADLPEAGEVLDRRLRTGMYCAFEPSPDDPVRWVVQS